VSPHFEVKRLCRDAREAAGLMPAIYYAREFVAAHGLMSYGTSIRDAYRQTGMCTGKSSKARTSGNRGRGWYCARPLNSRLGGVYILIREPVLVL